MYSQESAQVFMVRHRVRSVGHVPISRLCLLEGLVAWSRGVLNLTLRVLAFQPKGRTVIVQDVTL